MCRRRGQLRSGRVYYRPIGTEEEWERSVLNFRHAAQYARDKGITLAVEPINRFETFFLNTAADAVRFCKGRWGAERQGAFGHLPHGQGGKELLPGDCRYGHTPCGYLHAYENDRGTPGTGLVQWNEVFRGLRDADYPGWVVIESFVPDIKELARVCAVWRQLAPSADYLAREGLRYLRRSGDENA